MISLILGLFSYGIFVFFFFFILALIIVSGYILPAIALYNMGKNAGYPYPWLAFIPVAQLYMEYTLPKRKFKALFLDMEDRKTVAIIAIIALNFGSAIITALNVIPALGQILDIALAVFLIALNWRKMYDLHMTFRMDEDSANLWAILGLFIPIVYPIILLKNMKNEPEYGFGNYTADLGVNQGSYTETGTDYSGAYASSYANETTGTYNSNPVYENINTSSATDNISATADAAVNSDNTNFENTDVNADASATDTSDEEKTE